MSRVLFALTAVVMMAVASAQTGGTSPPAGPCPTGSCTMPLPSVCALKTLPFGPAQCANCVRRCGHCIGDPHCETFDGVHTNAQWIGEGVIVKTATFTVTGVATPLPGITGPTPTSLTEIYVNEGVYTFKFYYGTQQQPFLKVRNGVTVIATIPLSATPLLYGTIRINKVGTGNWQLCTSSGHIAHVSSVVGRAIPIFGLIVSVDPRSICSSAAVGGILGSPDGIIANDLKAPSGAIVTVGSPDPVVYSDFVQPWVYPAGGSYSASPSIAFEHKFRSLDTFVPFFGDANTMALCPPACNADFGCCLDFQVGGPDAMAAYQQHYNALTNTQSYCCPEAIDACASVHSHCVSIAALAASFPPEFSSIATATSEVHTVCLRLEDDCNQFLALCPSS